jgi:hypothetical protein
MPALLPKFSPDATSIAVLHVPGAASCAESEGARGSVRPIEVTPADAGEALTARTAKLATLSDSATNIEPDWSNRRRDVFIVT